ncbi:putative 6-phosphofructokinase [Helianthus annuus]|nr:putative 6-phosphofructokinase [Helianthus annuus]
MDLSLSLSSPPNLHSSLTKSLSFSTRFHKPLPFFTNFTSNSQIYSIITGYQPIKAQSSNQNNTPIDTADAAADDDDDGFIFEDVPHLTNFLPDLPIGEPEGWHCVILSSMKLLGEL